MTKRFGVIVFPGSNCDHDAYYVINNHLKCSVEFVWHKETNLNNYDCIQLFTNDAALPYLFKKPNCSKYYFIYSLGSVEDQNDLIKNMKRMCHKNSQILETG